MAERAHPEDPAFQDKLFGLKKNKYKDYLLRRYKFCRNYVSGKIVLDVPCGVGWGTSLLTTAQEVYGVDIAQDAIDYAIRHFQKKNYHYQTGDMSRLDFSDKFFDAVVCLEGYEHVSLEIGLKFLDQVNRVLKKDGLFIMTTPVLTDGKHSGNPYHLNEPALEDIKKTLHKHFEGVSFDEMPGPENNIIRFVGKNR